MSKKIIVDAIFPQETRVAIVNKDSKITAYDYESSAKVFQKGNIYLGRVTRVEPSLQAAFVEYDDGKSGFLPFSEIHHDYYQIPAADKIKIKEMLASSQEKSIKNSRSSKFKGKEKVEDEDDIQVDENKLKFELTKRYKIQEVVKKQQLILVQVIKEERGNKGVSLTSYISLAGRYCVLMPNSTGKAGGVSRKIDNPADRKRLKDLIKGFNVPKGTSLILRTAVVQGKDSDIKKDYEYLVNLWNNIRKATLSSSAPALIHQEADITKRIIRDHCADNINEIIVEGEDAYNKLKKFAKLFLPDLIKKIRLFKNKVGIFEFHKLEDQIEQFYQTTAPLESGGYLVINITEALVSIDVNSGKANKERSVEETAVKTNLEAARELARQLRIRDLSGLIVVDFIDMLELSNRKKVERELRNHIDGDKARIQLGRISNLGLFEMSRQRLKPSLIESNMVKCHTCDGTGYARSFDIVAVDILRSLRRELYRKGNNAVVRIYTGADIATKLINFRKNEIFALESQFNVNIFFETSPKMHGSHFDIVMEKSLNEEDAAALEADIVIDLNKATGTVPRRVSKDTENLKLLRSIFSKWKD